ncbi:cysteine hydrolase family protein [Roseateles flavus]|uniref:Isochorismatase family protein n=1 Tax=Roseateles flavus TaxID=3149041 RepID=A0ABV0GGP9_9BURK
MKIAGQHPALPRSDEVLLLVDVISSFRFPGGAALARQALPVARAIQRLKQSLQARGVPAIHANDNEGRWHARFDALQVQHRTQDKLAAEIAQRLVLVGLSTDFCIQFTAMDACLRGCALHIPGDCTATLDPRHKRASLAYMRRVLKADTRRSGA